MSNLNIHCALSKKRTGFDFKELHQWIDKPQTELGVDHRIERHAYNREDEQKIIDFWTMKKGKIWADKAVVEWLFHIAIDNLETAIKKSKTNDRRRFFNLFKIGICDTGYVYVDMHKLTDLDMDSEFRGESILYSEKGDAEEVWICEFCNIQFKRRVDCEKHEKSCGI
jgi:hypothetical protein